MRRTSFAILELPDDILVMLSFHFLFSGKHTPACPLLASEWYNRWPLWRVVKSFLLSSDFSEPCHVYFSSSSSSCGCSLFSNVLTLYVVLLDPEIISTPCTLGGTESPPRSLTSMLQGTRGLGIIILCMLVYHGLPFHADQSGLEGGTEVGVPSLGSCVPSTEELYLAAVLLNQVVCISM